MKAPSVLHFSTADLEGGSARSAYRIHSGLRQLGHHSRMLVGQHTSEDPDVAPVRNSRLARYRDRAADLFTARLGLQYLAIPSSRAIKRHPWLSDADIIQLYNIHGGYLSLWTLRTLSNQAPIVWRLSDLWPMTGHCAYPGDCDRWRQGCGRCPDLSAYPAIGIDTTAMLFRLKRNLYNRARITVVAPSSWTEQMARQSPLLGHFPIRRIPNGLDEQAFAPRSQAEMRNLLGLPQDETIVLFVAHGLDDNTRKGVPDLIEIMKRLPQSSGIRLVLIGAGGAAIERAMNVPVTRLGLVRDERLMAAAYAAADLLLLPSVLENLPNVALEAMACGLPVVGYDTGGVRDVIHHHETGWLSPSGDVAHMAEGVAALLDSPGLRERLGTGARRLIERDFTAKSEANRFAALYQEIAEGAPLHHD